MGIKDLVLKFKDWLNEPWTNGSWGYHWHDNITHVEVEGAHILGQTRKSLSQEQAHQKKS